MSLTVVSQRSLVIRQRRVGERESEEGGRRKGDGVRRCSIQAHGERANGIYDYWSDVARLLVSSRLSVGCRSD